MSIFNTIKFKFTSWVFFLIIVLTAFLAALSYEHEKKAIERRIYDQLNATADLKKEFVVSYINERISDLKALSSARDIIESISLVLNNKPGAFRTEHLIHIYQHLEAFQKTYPDYLSIDVTDFNGNVIVSTGHHPHGSGKHTHKHEHKEGINKYIDIIKQGEAVVMQEYLDAEERHLDAALGLKDKSGNIRAVIISSILLNNTLFPIFNDYTGLGLTGETLLVKLSGDNITYINPTRYPLRKKAESLEYCKDYFKLCLDAVSGSEGIGEGYDYRGRKIIGAYRYIPALSWGLVAKIDIDEAFKEITALRKRIFVFGTLILAVTLAISYFVVSRFTLPIVSLAQKTKAVASGDYSVRIEPRRKDEIGNLQRDFNNMVEALNNTKMEVESKQTELEEANFELERRVSERTAEITKALEEVKRESRERERLEEQLFHSQKMEAIGTLTGGIAHDFNNILTTIIGYASLLRMNTGTDDPAMAYIEPILASAEKAANLTNSLLAFSRKQIMTPKPVNINDIVTGMKKMLSRIIGEDIELRDMLTDKDLIVMADRGQIEQVLMNLATNARDAMPDGGLLTIETGLVEMDDEYIKTHGYGSPEKFAVVTVTDTGIGFDEKTKERIFEPFFTTKEVGKGTGLGLSIVYGIIKQHNGYINCYSEHGKGTAFKIYLPLIKSEIEKEESRASLLPKGGTETVLMAEDEEEVRRLTKEVLERFGYKVIEAANGQDAVNKFKENKDRVQLLVLDVIMPIKNGREAYNEIKEIKPDIKALFMSGYTADIIYKKGIIEEGQTFISKPVMPEELLKKVREVLDSHS